MAQEQKSKYGTPMFEPEVFRKQMYCNEESTCNIAGTFWRPGNHAPLVTPLVTPFHALCFRCKTCIFD